MRSHLLLRLDRLTTRTGHFMTNPGHRISGDLLIFCGVSQIWTPAIVFRCFLGVWDASAEKNWRKLESPAGKCMHTKPKVGVKIRCFRELCYPKLCDLTEQFSVREVKEGLCSNFRFQLV